MVVHESAIYVGGVFTAVGVAAGGQPATYVARWNGTHWSTLGTGINGPVYTITTNGN